MTREALKKKIKDSFGTYSRFTELAELDRYEFQRDFLTSVRVSHEYVTEISHIFDRLVKQEPTLAGLPLKLKSLRRQIKASGGVVQFCRDNPEFSQSAVSNVLNQSGGGYMTLMLKLFKRFGI